MPAKSYVENPYFGEFEDANVNVYSSFESHNKLPKTEIPKMQETATKLSKRERLKLRMARALKGEIKTGDIIGRRHHVRFWKNSKLSSAAPLQTQSTTPSNSSSPATRTSSPATSLDSRSWNEESVIYSPLGPPLTPNEEATHVELIHSSEEITRISSFETTPQAFDLSKYTARAISARFSSGSSEPVSPNRSEAFSPTDGFGAGFTPITPMPVDESKSAAAKPADQIQELVSRPNASLVDNRAPGKVPAVRSCTMPITPVELEEDITHANFNRHHSLPSTFIVEEGGLRKAQPEVRLSRESIEVSTKQAKKIRFHELNNRTKGSEGRQYHEGQCRRLQQEPQTNKSKLNLFSRTWENLNEESWYVRVLHEYCPVRFRKNKRLNFDSHQFRAMQSKLTFEALVEQEVRRQDRKLIFRPNNYTNKSFIRRWFNFEEDKDILDSMDHFILCNEGLTPIFRGSRPAVRKHLFRRWLNFDRNRAIICEQLMERWLEDKQYVNKLKKGRDEREQMRAEMETRQKDYDKIPPPSFFIKKLMSNLSGNRSRIGKPPKRGSQIVVLKKEPLFGSQYFENKKTKAKRWIKDLLLGMH